MSTTELVRATTDRELMRAFAGLVPGVVLRAWKVRGHYAWELCRALGIEDARAKSESFYLCEYRREIAGRSSKEILVLDKDPATIEATSDIGTPKSRHRTEELRHEALDSAEMWSAVEAAESIHTSRQYIHQLRKNGELIGLMHPARQRGLQFPKWQFQRGVAGKPLKKVLSTLKGLDDWDKWLFFTTPDEYLYDLTPLQVLTREVRAQELPLAAQKLLASSADERLARVVAAASGYVND